jgi:8-oxo-dGTP diphosphatase
MPQSKAYSIVVVARASPHNDLKNRVIAPSPPHSAIEPVSRNNLKKSFKREPSLENFSTPVLVVAVALIDRDARTLLQRRRIGGEHGGLWEFPGGKVEAGETPQAAALREIEEELGVRLDPALLTPLSFAADTEMPPAPRRPHVIMLYTCRRWQGEVECREGEEVRWFAAGELAGLAMPPLDYPLAAALRAAI